MSALPIPQCRVRAQYPKRLLDDKSRVMRHIADASEKKKKTETFFPCFSTRKRRPGDLRTGSYFWGRGGERGAEPSNLFRPFRLLRFVVVVLFFFCFRAGLSHVFTGRCVYFRGRVFIYSLHPRSLSLRLSVSLSHSRRAITVAASIFLAQKEKHGFILKIKALARSSE